MKVSVNNSYTKFSKNNLNNSETSKTMQKQTSKKWVYFNWFIFGVIIFAGIGYATTIDETNIISKNIKLYPNQLNLNITPIGNADASTVSAFALQSNSDNSGKRQFLGIIGINSTTGWNDAGNLQDHVALYTSAVAFNGSGDIWVHNILLNLQNYSNQTSNGNYKAQAIELDLNNHAWDSCSNYTGVLCGSDRVGGLTFTGSGEYTADYAIAVETAVGNNIWDKGFVVSDSKSMSFADFSNSNYSLYIHKNGFWGIYQQGVSAKNYFAGNTGFGLATSNPTSAITINGSIEFLDGQKIKRQSSQILEVSATPNNITILQLRTGNAQTRSILELTNGLSTNNYGAARLDLNGNTLSIYGSTTGTGTSPSIFRIQMNNTFLSSNYTIFSPNTTALDCNSLNGGAIYYDNSTKKHYGCNSTTWNALY